MNEYAEIVEKLSYDLLRVYIIQGVILLCVLLIAGCVVFPRFLRWMVDRFPRLKRIKVGSIEAEMNEEAEKPAYNHEKSRVGRRSTDVCKSHAEIITACLKNSEDTIALFDRAAKGDELARENWEDIQKLLLYSDTAPVEDRMMAGLRLVYREINGAVHATLVQMIQAYPEVYRMAIKNKPKYKLKDFDGDFNV